MKTIQMSKYGAGILVAAALSLLAWQCKVLPHTSWHYGENEPICRVSLLEDTNGDGAMDKSSVFIDSLVLPRMMLCVGHKLLVNETFTYNIYSYADTNGDGVADQKEAVYENPKADTRNLEHQKSGLVWNMDNWIYVSCDPVRYRYTSGKLIADTLANGGERETGTGESFREKYFLDDRRIRKY